MYYLKVDGYRITVNMTLGDLIAKHGAVKVLESKGFQVIKAN